MAGKIKFLNFREVLERLEKNLLAGQSLRGPTGRDNGVRLLDLDQDSLLDVVIGNEQVQQDARLVVGEECVAMDEYDCPVPLVEKSDGAGISTAERGSA